MRNVVEAQHSCYAIKWTISAIIASMGMVITPIHTRLTSVIPQIVSVKPDKSGTESFYKGVIKGKCVGIKPLS